MYLPTYLKTTKSEQLNKQYYRMLNGNIVPFEGKFVILDKLPNASPYEAGDYCFLYAPVYFVDGLKWVNWKKILRMMMKNRWFIISLILMNIT